jgi:hypothetical protein
VLVWVGVVAALVHEEHPMRKGSKLENSSSFNVRLRGARSCERVRLGPPCMLCSWESNLLQYKTTISLSVSRCDIVLLLYL